jgi:hypothetical protein
MKLIPIQEMVQNEFKTVSQPNKYNILSINTNHPIITRIKEHNDEHIFLPFLALTGLELWHQYWCHYLGSFFRGMYLPQK